PLCARRVAILLITTKYFRCRQCHGLSYESQRATRARRVLRRGQKIRSRLGGGLWIFGAFPRKPNKMRWQTYLTLRAEAEKANTEYLELVLRKEPPWERLAQMCR